MENIRSVIDPLKIDYIIANHSEPDHSISLPDIINLAPKATVVVSKRGLDSFEEHYHQKWDFKAIQTRDKISLGKNELIFVEAPMLHWSDSMFTYLHGNN